MTRALYDIRGSDATGHDVINEQSSSMEVVEMDGRDNIL